MSHNYTLRVTTGSEYDPSTHQVVPVNTATPVSIESDLISVDLNVRVQNYRGLPRRSPSTSPYFSQQRHAKNKDAYSICFSFRLKEDINGNDLVFGNDFDHPIRDRLPPGFSTAFKIVKWDPGLDGDVYADEPYLYGPAASSINTIHVGSMNAGNEERIEEGSEAGLLFEEGGSKEGLELRRENDIPDTEAARKKYFLQEENRKNWRWEAGRSYGCDFFNPYLDFNEFALKLPGFTLPIMKYWDGQGLRYVLKNRATNQVLFVVLFTLYLNDDLDAAGNVKPGVEAGRPFQQLSKEEMEKHEKAAASEESSDSSMEEKTKYYDADDDVD